MNNPIVPEPYYKLLLYSYLIPHSMKVWNDIDQFFPGAVSVVTTGTFDGVHLGHQRILEQVVQCAKKKQGESILLTFHPHPRMVLDPLHAGIQLLTTLEERKRLLERSGLDHLVVLPFTRELAQLSSGEFIREILVKKLRTRVLVIGYNHRFGKNREGSFAHLKEVAPEFGFIVEEIKAVDIDQNAVSSTRIRQSLHHGDIQTANALLGYEYSCSGTVIHGDHRGSSLGFPTANMEIQDPLKLIPANGVYSVTSSVGGVPYKGMMNIGTGPTFKGKKRKLEVHLLGFTGDLYGETLQICFRKRIRDERTFAGPEELRAQLLKDRSMVALEA